MIHPIWKDYPVVAQALIEVKDIIKKELRVGHPQVTEKILEYVDSSGKYLRSGLTLLLAQLVEGGELNRGKYYLAAGIEVLHLATLIHDDVIDEADTRRGIEVLHKSHSNRIAVYAGDYLLAYAMRLLHQGQQFFNEQEAAAFVNQRILERILAGELAQLLHQHKQDMTMKDYLKQIKGKTAFLFGLACQLGAWTPQTSSVRMRESFHAGQAIGMAFQLSDDLLDYQVAAQDMGKPAFQDIQNGIYTAPFLLGLAENHQLQKFLKKDARDKWSQAEIEELQAGLSATRAYEETEKLIERYLKKSQLAFEKAGITERDKLASFLQTLMQRKY